MAYRVKLRKQGGSLAVTLPAEVVKRLVVREGAVLYLVEDKPGEYRLTPYDPAFADAMDVYQRGAEKYRNALRKLAE